MPDGSLERSRVKFQLNTDLENCVKNMLVDSLRCIDKEESQCMTVVVGENLRSKVQ